MRQKSSSPKLFHRSEQRKNFLITAASDKLYTRRPPFLNTIIFDGKEKGVADYRQRLLEKSQKPRDSPG